MARCCVTGALYSEVPMQVRASDRNWHDMPTRPSRGAEEGVRMPPPAEDAGAETAPLVAEPGALTQTQTDDVRLDVYIILTAYYINTAVPGILYMQSAGGSASTYRPMEWPR